MALIAGSSLQSTSGATAQNKTWTLLNTYEAASSSIVEITDFSTEYDDYIIYIDRISSTDNGADFCMRVNDISNSEYSYSVNVSSGTSYNGMSSTGDTEWHLGSITTQNPELNNYNYSSFIVQLNNINDSVTKPHFISQGTELYNGSTYIATGSGHLKQPITIIEKASFFVELETITTGQFKVYGIKG